jgi:hypothetical protein
VVFSIGGSTLVGTEPSGAGVGAGVGLEVGAAVGLGVGATVGAAEKISGTQVIQLSTSSHCVTVFDIVYPVHVTICANFAIASGSVPF